MIISCKLLVPMTSPPLVDTALFIKEGKILAIGRREEIRERYPGEELRDYPNGVILPGLINLHTHLEYSALGDFKEPTPFMTWLEDLMVRTRELSAEAWENSYRKGIGELKRCGVTTVVDIARRAVGLNDLIASGLRALYCIEFVAVDDTRLPGDGEELDNTLKDALAKAEGTRVQIGLAPHSVYTLSKNALSFIVQRAREKNLFLTIHLSESQAESELIRHGGGPLKEFLSRYQLNTIPPGGCGISPATYLSECGALENRMAVSHAVRVDDADLRILQKRGIGVALCVRSNQLLQNGVAPVEKMRRSGLRCGIGTDSLASNSSLDLFDELRFFRDRYGGFSDEELLRMATIDSAEILGLSEIIGSIQEGKKADLVVMNLKRTVGPSQVYQYLIDEGRGEDVLLSLVDGEVIFERGAT